MALASIAVALLHLQADPELDRLCERAAASAITQFTEQKVVAEDLSIFVMDRPRGRKEWRTGGNRPDFVMYPASVVKLFYLAYGGHLRSKGKLDLNEEHARAFRDMIKDSNNDATGLVLDVITNTTGGSVLPEKEMAKWMTKRQVVNKWLSSLGIPDVNACQKTWNEGPYGRERLGYGPKYELRNNATSRGAALMMASIVDGRVGRQEDRAWMLDHLHRSLAEPDGQTRTYIGKVTPKDCQHYSKAGSAYQVRHDVAYIVAPDGHEVVLSIFTDHHIGVLTLLPFLAESVLKGVGIVDKSQTAWSADLPEDP